MKAESLESRYLGRRSW
jgi:hypothetical protein